MMRQYSGDVFDFFGNEYGNAIQTFCNNINSSQADIFVIMAHKAVLLYQILLEQGYIDKNAANKIVITNFALDFDSRYLQGKRIAILDDIVISGTSIASTVQRLMSFGVVQDNIEIIAVAIDEKYFTMQFTTNDNANVLHCDCVLSDASCIELSSMISKTFSCYGVPYDVDFPMYKIIGISVGNIRGLYNTAFWKLIDVSNSNQATNGVTAFTIIPEQSLIERLWRRIGIDVEECADVKIRMYLMHYPDDTCDVIAIPMCLFREITEKDLKLIYEKVGPTDQNFLLNRTESPIALMRYVEFYLSHCAMKTLKEMLSIIEKCELSKTSVLQLFGINDGEVIYRQLETINQPANNLDSIRIGPCISNDRFIIDEYKQSATYKESCDVSINWLSSSSLSKSFWINYFNYVPFLWWYETKEITARNTIKERELNYVNDVDFILGSLNRLIAGLSMNLLEALLKDRVPDFSMDEVTITISSFLDRAIDEGVIVPTIFYNGERKVICRAYRHGEDLPFGSADQYRLVFFLQSFFQNVKCAGIEGQETKCDIGPVSMEKIIVLFYQIGLRVGGVFNRFLGFDNTDIIHSFLSIHGTIQGYTKCDVIPHIYSEKDERGNEYITWLTSWLCDQGLLIQNWETNTSEEKLNDYEIDDEAIHQYLTENNRSVLSDSVKDKIKSIAEMISLWYTGMLQQGGKQEFRDDVTALTSCANPFVYASAIATEIHYFKKYYENQIRYAVLEAGNYSQLIIRLSNLASNRNYTADITQSLYSGKKKIEWRKSKKANDVVEKAQQFMSETASSIWKKIWSGIDSIPDYKTKELQDNTHLAEAMLYFFNAYFACLQSEEFWVGQKMPDRCREFEDGYLQLANNSELIDTNLFLQLKELATDNSVKSFRIKKDNFFKLGRRAVSESEQCVKNIENLVQVNDPAYTVKYTSALIIDIYAINPSDIEKKITEVWENSKEDRTKTMINIIRFPKDLWKNNFQKYGFFIAKNEIRPLDTQYGIGDLSIPDRWNWLKNYFDQVCCALSERVIDIRGILLPSIAPVKAFKHNLQKNIDDNSRTFYQDEASFFEDLYQNDSKMQLILGLDHHLPSHLLETLKSKWEITTVTSKVPDEIAGLTCYSCTKKYVEQEGEENNLRNRISYSQLQIIGAGSKGLGLLVRICDRVICVSCNHIIVGCTNEHLPEAISAFDPKTKFHLKPYTAIQGYASEETILPAEAEVAILEPIWHGNIPFDMTRIVSLDDWGDGKSGAQCKMFAEDINQHMHWVTCGAEQGNITMGYHQIENVQGSNIGDGCSGGVYMCEDKNNESNYKLIGMHEGRYGENETLRVIPWTVVRNKINRLFGGM